MTFKKRGSGTIRGEDVPLLLFLFVCQVVLPSFVNAKQRLWNQMCF